MLGLRKLTGLIPGLRSGETLDSSSPSGRMSPDEKSVFREIMAHDLAESKRLKRMERAAAAMGLDQLPSATLAAFDRPYPDRNTINVHGGGFLKGALTALACAGIGGASVFGLSQLFGGKPDKPPIVKPADPITIDNTKGVKDDVRYVPDNSDTP